MTATLRRVLVRPPSLAGFATWHEYGWRSEPDVAKLADEHASEGSEREKEMKLEV